MDATVNNSWYDKVFARVYEKLMAYPESRFLLEKRKALLKDISGKILEIGSGNGINFPLYNKNATVIACEPSVTMFEKSQAKAKGPEVKARINVVNMGVQSDVLYKLVPKESIDAVVCTLVLCTIPDYLAAIKEIQYFLKPGGKLIVLEHVRAKSEVGALIQTSVNPLWNICADGCHLNRPTDIDLKKAGLKVISEEYFTEVLPFYQAVMIK